MGSVDDALKNLAKLFPSIDKVFLEDVFAESNKDFDKTVDQLLGMGIDMDVGKKDPTKQQPPVSYSPVMKPNPITPQYNPAPTPTYSTPVQQPATSNSVYTLPTPHSPPLQSHTSPHPVPHAPLLAPTHSATGAPLLNSGIASYNMFNTPATPPPIGINSSAISNANPPAPTAPLVNSHVGSSQVDQRRMETMKQELSLEYQRINEKHKYNLELQQKLEQLSNFTSSEQKKLEEQRALFQEEKRKYTEELSSRFKALQDDFNRQKEELEAQEEHRRAASKTKEENDTQAKEEKRQLKAEQNELAEKLRQEVQEVQQLQIESLNRTLEEKNEKYENMLRSKNEEIDQTTQSSAAEISSLSERVKVLEKQVHTAQQEASDEVLTYFSSVVSSLASGIHAVSLARANNTAGESEGGDPLKELKQTFFKSLNDDFVNKLRDL